MKNILRINEPFISLIVTGQKSIMLTDKDTKFSGGTVYLLCDGIDYDFCEKYDIPSSNYTEDNIGKILAVMYLGAKTKTTYMEVSKLFKKTLDDPAKFLNHKDIFKFNIGKKVSMYDKSVSYINKYGEPEKFDDWLFTTCNEFRDSVMSRKHESGEVTDFKSPITCCLQDCTSRMVLLCHFHNAINTYMGCSHNCQYCLSKVNYGYNGMWTSKKPVPADFSVIENTFYDAFNTVKNNVVVNLIRTKQPVKIGISTDPLQPIEIKERITLKTVKLLNSYDYPFVLLSKGIAYPEIIDAFVENSKNGKNMLFQQTLLTLDKDITKKLEPGAPSPQERLDNIENLVNNGIVTQVRLEPWLIGLHTDERGNLLDVKEMEEYISTLSDLGVIHLMTRHYTRNTMTDIFLREVLDINYSEVYKKSHEHVIGHCLGGEFGTESDIPMIPDSTVYIRFAKQMKEILDKYGMTFAPRACTDIKLFSGFPCCSFQELSKNRRDEWFNSANKTTYLYVNDALKREPNKLFTSHDLVDLGYVTPDTDKTETVFHDWFSKGYFNKLILDSVGAEEDGKEIGIQYANGLDRMLEVVRNRKDI